MTTKTFRTILIAVFLIVCFNTLSSCAVARKRVTTTTVYSVDGGTLTGRLTPLESASQFQSSDTQFLIDPAHIADSIIRPKFFVVQGSLSRGQWTYPYQVRGHEILTMSVAINAIHHTQLIASGAPTQQELKKLVIPHSLPTSNWTTLAFMPSEITGAYTITQWFDPVGIEVNRVTTLLVCDWSQLSGIVSNCQGSDSYDMDKQSGWYVASHNSGLNYEYAGTQASSYSNFKFRNTQFPSCVGSNAVDVYYQPNVVSITANGSFSGSVNTWVASNAFWCVGLLHYVTFTSEYY